MKNARSSWDITAHGKADMGLYGTYEGNLHSPAVSIDLNRVPHKVVVLVPRYVLRSVASHHKEHGNRRHRCFL